MKNAALPEFRQPDARRLEGLRVNAHELDGSRFAPSLKQVTGSFKNPKGGSRLADSTNRLAQ